MDILVKCKINPTEDGYKVLKALRNIFPDMEFEEDEDRIHGRSDSIEDMSVLKELIESQSIRDSARKAIRKGSREGLVMFDLNKQAASVSKINFSSESPLGPINVKIRGNVNEICDYLAPSTL